MNAIHSLTELHQRAYFIVTVQIAPSPTRATKARAARWAPRSSTTPHDPGCHEVQKAVNRAHARIRVLDERAVSPLKGPKIPAKLRCCPRRATAIVAAILVLLHIEPRR